MKLVLVAILIAIAAIPSLGFQNKKRDWQEGKLIDIKSEAYNIGTIGGIGPRERISYVINAGQYTYTISHLHIHRDKALPLTINSTVKFAIEKSKAYLIDEEGKEHDMKFEKKALNETSKGK